MASRHSSAALLLLGAALSCILLFSPPSVSAQVIPGQGRAGYWEAERARLRAERLQEVSPVMDAWKDGWNAGEPDAMLRLYVSDAALAVGGEIQRGHDEIGAALLRLASERGTLQSGLNDFVTGGPLVVALESLVLGTGNDQRTGTLLTTYIQTDDGWRIRAQTLSVSAPPSSHPQPS